MIEKTKSLADLLKIEKYFNTTNRHNDVPEHVKEYKEHNKTYELKGSSNLKAWF